MSDPVLVIDKLESFYGDFQALHGISLTLRQGELLSLIGSNGAGKSTLLKSVCGLVATKPGGISWRGQDISGRPANEIVKLGIALVPEGRRLFPSLSVEENLILGGRVNRPGPWNLRAIYDLFPILAEKRNAPSTSLSGGQQQMVSISRALMSNPDLLLLDELSLGLAPVVIKDIYQMLPSIIGNGMSVILVEQDVGRALSVAQHFICLQEGRVSLEGNPKAFSREQISAAYFGTGAAAHG
jgi:branched-chain amino acid transport system ATP-binding protein